VTDFKTLLRTLSAGGVEFILVGGVAAAVHGSARLTLDVDVVYRRSPDNIDRLAVHWRPDGPTSVAPLPACRSRGMRGRSSTGSTSL
jgi:hypothetical protein